MRTAYQSERVHKARAMVDSYKMTTPCVDCGQYVEIPGRMYLAVTPFTTYLKPLGTLVAGGASAVRLAAALGEREAVCDICFRKRQSEKWQEVHNRAYYAKQEAMARVQSTFITTRCENKKKGCPPPSQERIDSFARMGVKLGECNGVHIDGKCSLPYYDIETGEYVNGDAFLDRFKNGWRPKSQNAPQPAQPAMGEQPKSALESINDLFT